MATKAKKTSVKKSAKKSAKKTKTVQMAGEGYKGHRKGSLKEQLHQLFDKHGAEKARPLAQKLKVAEATINTSFSQFRTGKSGRASA